MEKEALRSYYKTISSRLGRYPSHLSSYPSRLSSYPIRKIYACLSVCLLLVGLSSCRKIDIVYYDPNVVDGEGVYVLCEGVWGTNQSTVDFLSYGRDTLLNNVYPSVNPEVVKELGDVGNDMLSYGGKLYLAINGSGKVEVTNLSLRRRTQIDIPNCRYFCSAGDYVYLTSFAGPFGSDGRQMGYVAKIDTTTLSIIDTCIVGCQPEMLAAYGGKLYVANSGGYMDNGQYDSTVSVIDLTTFREEKRIMVAPNLTALYLDSVNGTIYVSTPGDYFSQMPATFRIDLQTERVEQMPFVGTKMQLVGELLFYYSYSYGDEIPISFGAYNTNSGEITKLQLERASELEVPYGLMVDGKRLLIANTPSYTTPGYLYEYHMPTDGSWKSGATIPLHRVHRTGIIPGHFCKKK